MRILVTGAAGFIGFYITKSLLDQGEEVVGLDNLNNYYSPQLKQDRLDQLTNYVDKFKFIQMDLVESKALFQLFSKYQFTHIIHLAAQAGVRYSLENPQAYIDSNLVGFTNVLEACRHFNIQHLIYGSSSSVYGLNTKMPFSVKNNVDHPVSLYAATKKANELLAHSYSYLYHVPTTGLRFFTVYGPWGRPDMAYFKFTQKIFAEHPIEIYNHGNMERDFTYVDDIVTAILKLINQIPKSDTNWISDNPNPASSIAPYRLYNIGNHQPVKLTKFVEVLENIIGKAAKKQLLPIQPGDVVATYADVEDLVKTVDFQPNTPIEKGLEKFVEWYRYYYQV